MKIGAVIWVIVLIIFFIVSYFLYINFVDVQVSEVKPEIAGEDFDDYEQKIDQPIEDSLELNAIDQPEIVEYSPSEGEVFDEYFKDLIGSNAYY